VRGYLTDQAARSLTNGLVASRLDNCNSLLCRLPTAVTKRLQRVQNTAARIVTCTPRSEHITPVLKRLHWLPVEKRIQFKTLMHVFKCLHGQAPGYLSDMINVYQPQRHLGSAGTLSLVVPRARTRYGERRFNVSAATVWNKLPDSIQTAPSLNIFKKLLKTHLFTTRGLISTSVKCL
jgi:hypothetical protein